MPIINNYNPVEVQVFGAHDYESEKDISYINEQISKAERREVLTFYRGDNRSFDVISQSGFQAFNQTYTLAQGRNLIAHLFKTKGFCNDFINWWIYPAFRTICRNDAPFISTGLQDAQYGIHEYIIRLKKFNLYRVPSIAVHKCWIGFDGDTLASSTIMGIQVNQGEFDFIRSIPAEYIQPLTRP